MTATTHLLKNKTAIIFGSARNMGRAFAEALASQGANIVLHHHGASSAGDAATASVAVKQHGVDAIIAQGDLADANVVKKIFADTLKAFGSVDIVINCAGVVIKKPFVEYTEEDFDRSFSANAKGAFLVMQEAARNISDNGRIISIGTSLLGAYTGYYSVYAGSKAPLEDFTRALSKEIGNRGVTVNVVAPGPVDTGFFHGQETPEAVAYLSAASVAGRLGQIQDIVPTIEFLVSPGGQWITGQTIFVNGGFVTR